MNLSQTRLSNWISLLLVLILGLTLTGCQKSAASADQPDIFQNLPEQQRQFCQIATRAQATGGSASADVRALLGSSGAFVAWQGQGSIHPASDGKSLAIVFTPACPDATVTLSFETGGIGNDDTSVPVGTRYANALQASDFSQGMIATGKLVRATDNSLITKFSMLSPARFAPMTSSAASTAGALSGLEQQARFCKLLQEEPIARQRLEDAASAAIQRNPLNAPDVESQKKALISKMFNDLRALVGPSGTFTGWRGRFSASDMLEHPPFVQYSTKQDKIVFVLSFIPDCFGTDAYGRPIDILTLSTYRGPLEDTNILPDSPFGQSLRQMDLSKPKYTVSGQFLSPPPPPKGGGQWVPAVDYRYPFYSGDGFLDEGSYHFVVRFTQVSP